MQVAGVDNVNNSFNATFAIPSAGTIVQLQQQNSMNLRQQNSMNYAKQSLCWTSCSDFFSSFLNLLFLVKLTLCESQSSVQKIIHEIMSWQFSATSSSIGVGALGNDSGGGGLGQRQSAIDYIVNGIRAAMVNKHVVNGRVGMTPMA
ncbi:hypothetical protein V6N11_053140 [Hibiscus sabdariffa]|uniref:Uncharacterized protein n=1 Tax=Hibiscus sabdariffa TaxID=183260 RepID=A0ABR2UC40_9ROSI